MPRISVVREYAQLLTDARDHAAQSDILAGACAAMSCSYFALSHHIDFKAAPNAGMRIHNYPEAWTHLSDQWVLTLRPALIYEIRLTA